MEIDARNQSLQVSMDSRDENLLATTMVCEHIINLKGKVANITKQLGELSEEVVKSSQQASVAESQ